MDPFLRLGFFDFDDECGFAIQGLSVTFDRDTLRHVVAIRKSGLYPRPALEMHGMSRRNQLGACRGREGDTSFCGFGFFGDADAHVPIIPAFGETSLDFSIMDALISMGKCFPYFNDSRPFRILSG